MQLYYQGEQIPIAALTALQSSQYGSCDASHCIDGIINCNGESTCDNYVCHTLDHGTQWLLITATGYPAVDKVIVYNRIDMGLNRINGATLIVSQDSTFDTIEWQAIFDNSASLTYTFIKPGNIINVIINIIIIIIIVIIIIIRHLLYDTINDT